MHHLSRRKFLALVGQSVGLGLGALAAGPGRAWAAAASAPEAQKGSFEFKIAQMLVVGLRGAALAPDNPIVSDIRDLGIGGIVLFDSLNPAYSNIQSPAQLRALTASLQELAPAPLLIAVDQEGGNVARLKERYGFRRTVSQQYLGSRDDLLVTRLFGLLTAETLAGSGINLNLAPVVDLNTNPDNPVIGRLGRSFSADHVAVTNHSLEVISAHHTQRVLTTLKHFPGHGSSREDSHRGFVDVTYTWSPLELEPYDKIIKAGLCDVVMTAHIFNANLDPDLPATLSEKTIGGLLRGRLNYDGVVMTDDLQMKAISDHYSFEDTIELALRAGVDMLTIGNNLMYGPGTAHRAVAIISSLVQSGRIPPERIEQSYQRIVRLKAWLTA